MSLQDGLSKIEAGHWRGVVVGPTMKDGKAVPNSVDVTPLEFINQPDASTKTISCIIGGGGSDGYGKFPGQELRPGQHVMIAPMGEQSGLVLTSIPDAKTTPEGGSDPAMGSFPPIDKLFAAVKTGDIPDGVKQSLEKIFQGKDYIRDITKDEAITAIKQFYRDNRGDITSGGRKVIETVTKEMKNPLRDDQKQGTPGSHKNLPQSIGAFATKAGSLKDPTSFIQSVIGKKGELIPNAFQMIQNLKSTGASGNPFSASEAIGGAGLAQGALAGIANKQAQQQNEPVDEDDYLCELFQELFPDFPCRINDIDTEQFRQWKREYLLALEEGTS